MRQIVRLMNSFAERVRKDHLHYPPHVLAEVHAAAAGLADTIKNSESPGGREINLAYINRELSQPMTDARTGETVRTHIDPRTGEWVTVPYEDGNPPGLPPAASPRPLPDNPLRKYRER